MYRVVESGIINKLNKPRRLSETRCILPLRTLLSCSFSKLETNLAASRFPEETFDDFEFLLIGVDELEVVAVDESSHETEKFNHPFTSSSN